MCAAAGSIGSSALVETGTISGLPSVTQISPADAPPGAVVTVTGTNFAPGSVAYFGRHRARTTSYVSESELKAVVPVGTGMGNVTVQLDGFVTRSTQQDIFDADVPLMWARGSTHATTGRVTYSARLLGIGSAPRGTVSFNDGHGDRCTVYLKGGSGSCELWEQARYSPYLLHATYRGSGRYIRAVTSLSETIGRTKPRITAAAWRLRSRSGSVTYYVALSAGKDPTKPTGTVTVHDRLGASCTALLGRSGHATCMIVKGSFQVDASYSGDANYLPTSIRTLRRLT
jgi:hypothetical protein